MGYKIFSLMITVCQHSASLVMPIGDPRDGFFYPTSTLMIDYYNNVPLKEHMHLIGKNESIEGFEPAFDMYQLFVYRLHLGSSLWFIVNINP